VGGPILPPGCPTVLIGGLPAARFSDMATCTGPPDVIVKGSMAVLIGSMPDQQGVTIKGLMIKVEGTATVEEAPITQVKGDGMLTLKGGVTMIN
jgi:uncharacterized Zn-binding protein involved in type VI secretion